MIKKESKFDLEERTARFGEEVIELCKKVPRNTITIPVIDQLVRAGTSIGANYCEANGASSRRDFRNKIYICKKESKESCHWLRMLAGAVPQLRKDCRKFWQEAKELAMIFAKIALSSSKN